MDSPESIETVDAEVVAPELEFPVVTLKKRRLSRPYLPKVEREDHKQWYAYYQQLGKQRSLQKVADHFDRSLKLVSIVSKTFNWVDRIDRYKVLQPDPVIVKTAGNVDNAREKLVYVVEEIIETMREIAIVSKENRNGIGSLELDPVTNLPTDPVAMARLTRLHTSLGLFGFKWTSTKDFRELVSTLKEVVKFNDPDKPPAQPVGFSGAKINKVQLLIQE